MKRFIIFTLMAVVLGLSITSCDTMKKDIETKMGREIKNLKVEKVKVRDNFYEYCQEYNEVNHTLSHLLEEVDKFQDKYNHANSMFDFYIDWNLDKAEECVSEMEIYAHYVDSLYQLSVEYLETVNEVQEKHKDGTVYVTKYVFKDKYGHWNNFNTYDVFTYNDNQELYTYHGDKCMDLAFSCFPEAEKEFIKRAKDFDTVFSSMELFEELF